LKKLKSDLEDTKAQLENLKANNKVPGMNDTLCGQNKNQIALDVYAVFFNL